MAKDDRWNDMTSNIFGCRDSDVRTFKKGNAGAHTKIAPLGRFFPLEMFSQEIKMEVLEAYKTLLSSSKFKHKEQEWKDNIKRVEAML